MSDMLQAAILADDADALRSSLEHISTAELQKTLNTNLEFAMSHSSLKAISLLFSLGARTKVIPFCNAITREDTGVFQALCNGGWNIDSTQHEYAAIHFAVEQPTLLRWLLDHGANPNTLSVRHPGSCSPYERPLSVAAELTNAESLTILLSYGATDHMAIYHAIGLRRQNNGTATMQALIDHGIDINYLDRRRGTPLRQAVHVGDEEKLKWLLDHGADPHAKNPESTSALERAKQMGRSHFVAIIEAASGMMGP
ncbi:ankyrin repeat-containing domain protein [Phaeosphaeria sp. MPI-PUGE-AT-0046c]|nr:ankyrin repeat-containing domain protein [Phaeosphaeria sp. MPI-PUGE-AT-0046c]